MVTTKPRSTYTAVMLRWGVTQRTALHVNHLLNLYPRLGVSSGRRTKSHNQAVGGSPTSWHLKGRACDFVGPDLEMSRVMAYAWNTGAIEVIDEGDHVHVAW